MPNSTPCKPGEFITSSEECAKAAKELQSQGKIKNLYGCRGGTDTWACNRGWTKNLSEIKNAMKHHWTGYQKGCWVRLPPANNSNYGGGVNHIYFNTRSDVMTSYGGDNINYPSICGKPSKEKGCKSIDGRYGMGDARRYTGGWALSNGEGHRTKCKALCESQPECNISWQY